MKTTEREARTRHVCSCGIVIEPGDYYLEHVASPDHDGLGNKGWWRIQECGDCAERYGRPTQSRIADEAGRVYQSDDSDGTT